MPAWDIPLDENLIVPLANRPLGNVPLAIRNDGRTDNLKVIYLQRLANPLMPYDNTPTDPNYNPYRTIDSMPIDMTAFNGINPGERAALTAEGYSPPITANLANAFYARQRGQNNGSTLALPNIWSPEPLPGTNQKLPGPNLNAPIPVAVTGFNFNTALHHSLGYLSNPFGTPSTTAGHQGDPANPFPWITWNNRPYVSPLELLLVPTTKSRDLLPNYATASGASPYTTLSAPYPHLLDFFQSSVPSTTAGASPQFHRILEYLGVPSPFVGTETWANPDPTKIQSPYLPPFDRISAYREPGRINLNTIYSQQVFNGLMSGFPNMQATWGNFVQSRSGGTSTNVLAMPVGNCPTEFAHPFRSFGGASMIPSLSGNLLAPAPNREINVTLLCENPTAAGQPLFQSPDSAALYNDTNRNPFFRYQGLERLGNLVTTRSNVYAVWITVGYFEVKTAAQVNGTISGVEPACHAAARRLVPGPRVGHRHRPDRTPPGVLYLRPHHPRRLPTRAGPQRE